MADLSLTAANIVPSVNATKASGTAGEALAAGDLIYKKASDGFYYKADANDSTKVPVVGMAACSAATAQPFFFYTADSALEVGSHSAGIGTPLFSSATAGKICPAADLSTSMRTQLIGITTTATKINFAIVDGGVVIP
jgi:hypothetical protein